MITSLQLKMLFWIAIIAWMLILFIDGEPLKASLIKPSSLVLSGLIILVTIFEKWAWSFRLFYPWFVQRPDLRGSWEVELKSTWINPDTGRQIDPIKAYMAIRQTLTTLSIRLMTEQSESQLVAHSFIPTTDGVHQLTGVYLNTPRIELRGSQSEIHYGSLLLQVHGDPVKSLEGHYWTDRKTSGSILLNRRKKTLFHTFSEANSKFQK